jgi:hypothetical protein
MTTCLVFPVDIPRFFSLSRGIKGTAMNPTILTAWNQLESWCDGGPTPDRETLREAFRLLVQGQGMAVEPDEAAECSGPMAENVIPFRR